MMTPKQNALESLHGERPEYVPASFEAFHVTGFFARNVTEHPLKEGKDIFGVPWVVDAAGPMQQPGFVMFDDVTEWKEYVKWPDLSQIDFKALAEAEFASRPVDRDQKLVQLFSGGAQFMRLFAFMGVENALCAMAMDPEACMDFFEAYTDYRIDYINRTIDAYNPDIYVISEDVATARGLFMSPETYRKLIKPFHARIIEAVNARGVISSMHCCGKCEDIIPDFTEMGVKIWQVGQALNDVAGILDKYKGVMSVEGGWTDEMKATYLAPDDDGEALREEVRRCLREYKKPGFVLMPTVLSDKGNPQLNGDPRWNDLVDEWDKNRWF